MIAACCLATALIAGCAQGPRDTSVQSQVSQLLRSAYDVTVSRTSLEASIDISVKSGVDLIESGRGTTSVWFAKNAGQTQLSAKNGTSSATVIAVRLGNSFYEAPTQGELAAHKMDLIQLAKQNPDTLPEIQAAGLDPYQLLTLFSAVKWPESVLSEQPTVTADSTGRRTDYEVVIDVQRLSQYVSAADSGWLKVMARESGGASITVTASLDKNGVSTMTASLPVPASRPVASGGGSTHTTKIAPPTAPQLRVIVTETFDYNKPVSPITAP